MSAVRPLRLRNACRGAVIATMLVPAACENPTSVRQTTPQVEVVTVAALDGGIFRSANVELNAPGAVTIEYWADGVERLSLDVPETQRRHDIWLPRLRAERSYAFEITPRSADGAAGTTVTGTFTTSALPADVAALAYERVEGPAGGPLLLIEVVEAFGEFLGAVIIDGNGEVVWYYRTNGRAFGTTRLANGDFVLLDVGTKLMRVSPDRREIASISAMNYGGLHHAITATSAGTVLFIAYDEQMVGPESVVGEAIWEWDPDAGSVIKRWSAFDHLDWYQDRAAASTPGNWLHANGLSIGPRDNVVVSLRSLNQIISLSADFKTLEWRLGGPNATIDVAGDALFLGQHDAQELEGDRVLLFDNGSPTRPYSRGLELALDHDEGTASVAWEFVPETPNFASILGSARRLDSGNTVVHFGPAVGVSAATGPAMTVEADAAGNVVRQLVAGPSLQRAFRSMPLATIGGEVVVD